MHQVVQIVRLPPGNMSQIMQIRGMSALKYLYHYVGVGDLSDVSNIVRKSQGKRARRG